MAGGRKQSEADRRTPACCSSAVLLLSLSCSLPESWIPLLTQSPPFTFSLTLVIPQYLESHLFPALAEPPEKPTQVAVGACTALKFCRLHLPLLHLADSIHPPSLSQSYLVLDLFSYQTSALTLGPLWPISHF